MSGTYFDKPMSVKDAIATYGAAAIPLDALDNPGQYAIDGAFTNDLTKRVRCTMALRADWLAAHTDYRRVKQPDGHSETLYLCPEDGQLAPHYDDHWDEEKGVHRRTVRS